MIPMLKIFITNLSEYNNENLIDKWILPSDFSFLNQTIIKILLSDDSKKNFIIDWKLNDKNFKIICNRWPF